MPILYSPYCIELRIVDLYNMHVFTNFLMWIIAVESLFQNNEIIQWLYHWHKVLEVEGT